MSSSDYSPPDLSLADAAVAMHEYFMSLLAAGFTEAQALRLIKPCTCGGSE